MARVAESAKSSSNRRAFGVINYSAQLCSTRSAMKSDGAHCENAEGSCQNRRRSSPLVYVSEASKAS